MAALNEASGDVPEWIYNASDEVPLTKWKEAQQAKWEKEGSKLKEKYPTQEELSAWLEGKCTEEKEKTIANRKTWFYVFFDMEIGGKAAGRILMSLRTDKTPKVSKDY